MSASRLFSLFGTSSFHHRTTLYPAHPIRFNRIFRSRIPPLRFRRYCSSSAAVDSIAGNKPETTTSESQHHPWPEWVAFVDGLKAKGYFVGNCSPAAAGIGGEPGENVYKDMNILKEASLSFARDRVDIFKSLSMEDISTVVASGCPTLFRKAVNSAKRLRAYVRLDEGDVCGACNLRASCDRAYVILKDSEAAARTVDIVRILLICALDPLVISGGEMPPDRAHVEVASRNLLLELLSLSETSPDTALLKPSKPSHLKKQFRNLEGADLSADVEMMRGDWMCPKCNFLNFAKNLRCLKCKEDGPKEVGSGDGEMKKGDWICPECSFMNFSRNIQCLKCKTKGPTRVNVNDVEMKKGDWNCSQCGFMNFASNRKCLRCPETRPKRLLNPGEWECPSCDFLNYRRNVLCMKCNCERPRDAATRYEEQLWPYPN